MNENPLQLRFDLTQQAPRELSKIAIVRHGEYGGIGKRLTEPGRVQMQRIGHKLHNFLTSGEVALILSSTAPRASDSAAALAEVLGDIPVEPHAVLWSDSEKIENFPAAHRLVHSIRDRDLLIVVTHYEYVHGFPAYLCREDFGKDASHGSIGTGEGVLIDYKAQSLITL